MIDTNIPVPEVSTKWGWEDLRVGWSFLAPLGVKSNSLYASARYYRNTRDPHYRIMIRRDKDCPNQFRVWRIA